MDSTTVMEAWNRARLARADRHRALSRSGDRLAGLVQRVALHSPRLVDGWEAAAIVESLGYSDRHVQSEFGLSDTRMAGEHVFRLMPVARALTSAPADRRSAPAAHVRGRLAVYLAALAGAVIAAISGADAASVTTSLAAAAIAVEMNLSSVADGLVAAAALPFGGRWTEVTSAVRRRHGRALAVTACASGLIVAVTGLALLPFAAATSVPPWRAVALEGAASVALALTMLNVMVLVELGRSWSAIVAVVPALATALLWRYGAGQVSPVWFSLGWPAAAASAAVVSAITAHRTLARFDYACAMAARRRAPASSERSSTVSHPRPR